MPRVAVAALFVATMVITAQGSPPHEESDGLRDIAGEFGWAAYYDHGHKVIKDLQQAGAAQACAEQKAKGARVAFFALGSAKNTCDTGLGYSLCLVDKTGKPLNPHEGRGPTVHWTYLIHGRIKNVSIKDKVITLEVTKSDCQFMDAS